MSWEFFLGVYVGGATVVAHIAASRGLPGKSVLKAAILWPRALLPRSGKIP